MQTLFGLLNGLEETSPLGTFLNELWEIGDESEADVYTAFVSLTSRSSQQPTTGLPLWEKIQKHWGDDPCLIMASDDIHRRINEQRAKAPKWFGAFIKELADQLGTNVHQAWQKLVNILDLPIEHGIATVRQATLERWGQNGKINVDAVVDMISNPPAAAKDDAA